MWKGRGVGVVGVVGSTKHFTKSRQKNPCYWEFLGRMQIYWKQRAIQVRENDMQNGKKKHFSERLSCWMSGALTFCY